MSIFYCRLASEKTKRMYQFLKKEWWWDQQGELYSHTVKWKEKSYTFCFKGTLIQQEKGNALLCNHHIQVKNDNEYLIALYRLLNNDVKSYISEDSFLLLDDGVSVFIYSGIPLYYARKRKGEIYISSDKSYLEKNNIFALERQKALYFFNNNLKTL
ncbi:MAG: hypothetical protein EOM50_00810 [Erysipelotrichia bacterium]|nr:hypothetical protein [Erysipelotrichia bacterium]NCC54906.1 hypothetical protein [Erysipelotrichia bacterium]